LSFVFIGAHAGRSTSGGTLVAKNILPETARTTISVLGLGTNTCASLAEIDLVIELNSNRADVRHGTSGFF
jgi:hypothetical protein